MKTLASIAGVAPSHGGDASFRLSVCEQRSIRFQRRSMCPMTCPI